MQHSWYFTLILLLVQITVIIDLSGSAKRGLIAFPDFQVWLVITPNEYDTNIKFDHYILLT